jgi:hypothetical protein
MAAKDNVSAGLATTINGAQSNRSRTSSLPKPEEGLRLIHAFVGIRDPELREAIVKFVEELTKAQQGGL